MSIPRQRTLSEKRSLEGVGLHTGCPVHIHLLPAPPDSGIRFRRTDLSGTPEIAARVENVVATDRGTTLGAGEARVHTVEHLLSALSAHRIDNALVEIDAAEPPSGDGSAQPFAGMITSAGVDEQDAPAAIIALGEAFSLEEGSSRFVVAPSAEYTVSTSIDFDHPLIGRQFGSFRIEPGPFDRELAPARTFGFLWEVDDLRGRGLAQGGTIRNAVVLTETGVAEGGELRFADEFVRHKTLDVVGDLALIGGRLQAHVVAERPGHHANVALAREILARSTAKEAARPVLDIGQILHYLPHRYPFLLVDRVLEFESRRRIVGLKNVTINEPFFVGHFPGRPIMPGVLIIEAMAQVGGLLVMDQVENPEDKIVYFMSLDRVKWRRPVVPGDQIRFELEVIQIRGTTCRMRGVGTVDGTVVAEAEMMARVVDR